MLKRDKDVTVMVLLPPKISLTNKWTGIRNLSKFSFFAEITFTRFIGELLVKNCIRIKDHLSISNV